MAFKLRNPFTAKALDKAPPELMETKRSDPDNPDTDGGGVSDGDESKKHIEATAAWHAREKTAVSDPSPSDDAGSLEAPPAGGGEQGDGLAVDGARKSGSVIITDRVAGDVNSDGSTGTVAEDATSGLKDTLKTQVRTVGDDGGEQGDGLAVDGAREGGVIIKEIKIPLRTAGDGGVVTVDHSETETSGEGAQPGGGAAEMQKQKTKSLQSNDRLGDEDDPGVAGDSPPAEAKVVLGGIKTSEESFRVADGGRSGDGSGGGSPDVVQYNESDLQREAGGGGGGVPEPVESANLNLSKSNINSAGNEPPAGGSGGGDEALDRLPGRMKSSDITLGRTAGDGATGAGGIDGGSGDGGGGIPEPSETSNLNLSKSNINRTGSPETDGDSPDAPAAMATNLNSSRSNVYRAGGGGGGGGGAGEPSAATINTTKSNTFGTGGEPPAGDSGPGLPEPVEASNLNLSKSDISLGRDSGLSTRGTVGDISLRRTGGEAPAGDGDGGGDGTLDRNITGRPHSSDITLGRTAGDGAAGDGEPGDPSEMEKGKVKFFNEKKGMADGADDAQAERTGPIRIDNTPARAAGEDGGGVPEAAVNTSHSNIKNMDATDPDSDGDGASAEPLFATTVKGSKSNSDNRLGDEGAGAPEAAINTSHSGIKNLGATDPTGDAPGGADALRHDTAKNSISNIRRETGPSAPVEGKPSKEQVAGESDASAGGDRIGDPARGSNLNSEGDAADAAGGGGGRIGQPPMGNSSLGNIRREGAPGESLDGGDDDGARSANVVGSTKGMIADRDGARSVDFTDPTRPSVSDADGDRGLAAARQTPKRDFGDREAQAAGEDSDGSLEAARQHGEVKIRKDWGANRTGGETPAGGDDPGAGAGIAVNDPGMPPERPSTTRETGPSAPVEGKPTKDQVAGESDASAGGGASGADRISTKEPTKLEVPNAIRTDAKTMCAACGAYLGGALHCPSCGADHDPERTADPESATGESDPAGEPSMARGPNAVNVKLAREGGAAGDDPSDAAGDDSGDPSDDNSDGDDIAGRIRFRGAPRLHSQTAGRGEVSDDGPGTPLEHIAVSDSGVVTPKPPPIKPPKREAEPGDPADDDPGEADAAGGGGVAAAKAAPEKPPRDLKDQRTADPGEDSPDGDAGGPEASFATTVKGTKSNSDNRTGGGDDAMEKSGPLADADPGGGAAEAKVSMHDDRMTEGTLADADPGGGAPEATVSMPDDGMTNEGTLADVDADGAREKSGIVIVKDIKTGSSHPVAADGSAGAAATVSNADGSKGLATGLTPGTTSLAQDSDAETGEQLFNPKEYTLKKQEQKEVEAKAAVDIDDDGDSGADPAATITRLRSNSYRTADSEDAGGDAAKIYTSADGKPGVATVLSPGADPDSDGGGLAVNEEGTHNIHVSDDGGPQVAAAGEQKNWLQSNFVRRTDAADLDDDGPSTLLDLSSVDASGAVAPIGDPDFDLLASSEALDPDSDADGIAVDPDTDAEAVDFKEALILE